MAKTTAKTENKPATQDWGQFSDSELADMIGALSAATKKMDERRKEIIQELLGRGAPQTVVGIGFQVFYVSQMTQASYKREKLEEVFGEEQLRQCLSYKTISATYRVSPLAQDMADMAVKALTAAA